ncbi:PREDICTED: inversin-A-like [Amphimedon queenslandica]|uniref:Death domain-containing protein n=1 Tax=Amphimedon queenslandica TaxID=400682 RepID=A0AAN0J8Z3_AMPQE|nr:PREDICTED: inversin-A-like [Amphimedon queenslandica]|eukprot:XP_019853173.1 PREDICTED: inversin-A-like [Amphimedon queenslandica]
MASIQTYLGLDIGDLIDIIDLLKRCGFPETKWYELALRLGLKKNTLDVIEAKHRGNVCRCMTECLSQWLGRADNVDSKGGANLDSLSDALQSMNETAVAEKLSKHFPTPEVGVVPETKPHDVLIVPQDNGSTNETKIPIITRSDSSSDTSSQSLLPQVEVHVPVSKGLLGDFRSMRMSYGKMFYNVGKIIKRISPPLEEIKEFLSCCGTILRRKVEQCSDDIPSVLRLIQDKSSLTDIELLHSVVEEMEITEAKECIETYKAKLKEFCKSLSVSLCLKERFASIPHLQCETITLVFDWEPEEHLLKDIKELLAKVSGKLLRIERQDVRQKELKEKDQDLLQRTEVVSYIILEEAEHRLRDAISSKEKETIELKQEQSMITILEEESLSSDPKSIKEVEEEPLDKELNKLNSQFDEIKGKNKDLSDKLSKIKIDYLRSLSSNTSSAAGKVRRGMSLEIDDYKFHLKAMKRPDYQPLVDNERIIEKLQEKITLTNMELITEREHNEKIIKYIKGNVEKKKMHIMCKDNKTPLHWAAEIGHQETVRLLLSNEATVDIRDKDGRTPLHYASGNGHLTLVQTLFLEYGADINAVDKDGRTLLHYASDNGHLTLVQTLILEYGADINAVDKEGYTPLHYASSHHLQVVEFLLEKGASPGSKGLDGCTPLHKAAWDGHNNIVKALLEKDYSIIDEKEEGGWAAISNAVMRGHHEAVETLIEYGADFGVNDEGEWSLLHIAARHGHAEVVEVLIDHKLDVNIKDKSGLRAFDVALTQAHPNVVETMLNHGASVNIRDSDEGKRALHIAVDSIQKPKRYEVVKLLLQHEGVDPDIPDDTGSTPLHYAVKRGYSKIVHLLLEYKADPYIKDKNDVTPLDIAQDDEEIMAIFREFGYNQ